MRGGKAPTPIRTSSEPTSTTTPNWGLRQIGSVFAKPVLPKGVVKRKVRWGSPPHPASGRRPCESTPTDFSLRHALMGSNVPLVGNII